VWLSFVVVSVVWFVVQLFARCLRKDDSDLKPERWRLCLNFFFIYFIIKKRCKHSQIQTTDTEQVSTPARHSERYCHEHGPIKNKIKYKSKEQKIYKNKK